MQKLGRKEWHKAFATVSIRKVDYGYFLVVIRTPEHKLARLCTTDYQVTLFLRSQGFRYS